MCSWQTMTRQRSPESHPVYLLGFFTSLHSCLYAHLNPFFRQKEWCELELLKVIARKVRGVLAFPSEATARSDWFLRSQAFQNAQNYENWPMETDGRETISKDAARKILCPSQGFFNRMWVSSDLVQKALTDLNCITTTLLQFVHKLPATTHSNMTQKQTKRWANTWL